MDQNYTAIKTTARSFGRDKTLPANNVPIHFRIIQIFISVLVLIVGCTLNILLLLHLKKQKDEANTRGTPVNKLLMSIAVVSLSVLLTGLPISILMMATDFSPHEQCEYLSYTHYHILFYGNALILHYIAVLLFDRFSALTNYKYRVNNNNIRWIIITTTIYVTLITAAMMMSRIQWQNVSKLHRARLNHCFFAKHVKELEEAENNAYITVVIIVIMITYCNVCFRRLTRKTLAYIKKFNKRVQDSAVGEQIQPLETTRIKVAFYLGILFDSMWIPFGIIAAIQYRVDPEISGTIKVFLYLLAYLSFGVFPVVYSMMDKRYITFLRNKFPCLRGNAVANAQ